MGAFPAWRPARKASQSPCRTLNHDPPALRRKPGTGDRHPESRRSNILKFKKRINILLSENTGQPLERIEKDTDRDYFMSAEEAREYGLIDKVIYKR
jgi:ATP-dependent Clp endopeptidase proteolytic subunit ClpP